MLPDEMHFEFIICKVAFELLLDEVKHVMLARNLIVIVFAV